MREYNQIDPDTRLILRVARVIFNNHWGDTPEQEMRFNALGSILINSEDQMNRLLARDCVPHVFLEFVDHLNGTNFGGIDPRSIATMERLNAWRVRLECLLNMRGPIDWDHPSMTIHVEYNDSFL